MNAKVRGTAALLVAIAILAYMDSGPMATAAPPRQATTTASVNNGLRTVNVETSNGTLTIKVPDDIRTGDTISGTLVEKPKGATDAERDQNRKAMRSRALRMMLSRAAGDKSGPLVVPQAVSVTIPVGEATKTPLVQTSPRFGNVTRFEFKVPEANELSLAADLKKPSDTVLIPTDLPASGDPAKQFKVPALAQTGRPVEIKGPFDGSAANSKINLTPLKGDEPPKPEDDPELEIIAESPRKSIVEIPSEFINRSQIDVEDNGVRGMGVVRTIDVSLAALKTSLIRGETTSMTVTVTGLDYLREPVPMTLQASGVVTMSGGMYQLLSILPAQVAGGSYTTTRTITGLQAGGWSAVATVVTMPGGFDLCVNDNSLKARLLLSSFTGGFQGVFSDGAYIDGISQTKTKGCIFTFLFTSKDLKLNASVDACARTGTANITAKKLKYTIADSDISDNVCSIK